MLNNQAFDWISFARSDVGKVRKINEDSCLDHGDVGLWAVADGMGGHAAGDVASSSITSTLGEIRASENATSLINETEKRLLDVNTDLLRQAAERPDRQTMGSTVAVLLAFHKHAFVLWAGDSRIYRLRDGVMNRITVDHSKVQELVDEGLINDEDAETHPEANIVTRAIGANRNLFIDLDIYDVQDGDRFLICSDGLFKESNETEIAELLGKGTPEQACNSLIEQTLARGSRDNVTAIVVQANSKTTTA